jgi:hypothetical protein
LQAVVQIAQQVGDDVVADTMTHGTQRIGQIAQAATGPQQRRFRVSLGRRFQKFPQVRQQRRVGLRQCQSALKSFQGTASKSFHFVTPRLAVFCAV